MRAIRGLLAGFALLAGALALSPASAQQILPNALTQFTDSNGAPLAGGSVTFYIPGTTAYKATFSDSALANQNANPVQLDAAGRAPIWGSGAYREIVQDFSGNQVWDRVTAGFNNTFFASGQVSTGSAGAYVLTSPGAPGYQQGVAYSFRPNFNSVGGDTLNVNGLGALPVFKASAGGATPISPNDIVAGFDVIAVYDSALNAGAGGFASITTSGVASITNGTNGGLSFSAPSGNVQASLAPGNLAIKVAPLATDVIVIGDSLTANSPKQATVGSELALLPGWIGGMILANDGGSPNTVLDIAPGTAVDATNTQMIQSTGNFTKLTTGSWVAGSGNNGMAPGQALLPNTWYYVYAIRIAGATDFFFSQQPTASQAPSGTTASRRIGSFLTSGSSNILGFIQNGDYFQWIVPLVDFSLNNPGTAGVEFVVRTPINFTTRAVIAAGGTFGNIGWGCTFFDWGTSPASPSFTAAPLMSISAVSGTAGATGTYAQLNLMTSGVNADLFMVCNGSDANTNVYVSTLGYFDPRGK